MGIREQTRSDHKDSLDGSASSAMKNISSLVSVVIPSFNHARYLKLAIESILNQNYKHVECFVIDGLSSDGTLEILKSYGNKIRWVSEADRGQVDAINKGFKLTQGEIFTWLNADDQWRTPDAVSKAVKFLNQHQDVAVVYGLSRDLDEAGKDVGETYSHAWDLAYSVEFCDHCIPQSASFMRRSAFEKVGMLDERFRQRFDHDLWLRIGLNEKIKQIPEVLALTSNQKGVTFTSGVESSCVEIIKKFYTLPGISEMLLKKKKRALSNAYLRGIQYSWQRNHDFVQMLKGVVGAVGSDVTNVPRIVLTFLRFVSLLAKLVSDRIGQSFKYDNKH